MHWKRKKKTEKKLVKVWEKSCKFNTFGLDWRQAGHAPCKVYLKRGRATCAIEGTHKYIPNTVGRERRGWSSAETGSVWAHIKHQEGLCYLRDDSWQTNKITKQIRNNIPRAFMDPVCWVLPLVFYYSIFYRIPLWGSRLKKEFPCGPILNKEYPCGGPDRNKEFPCGVHVEQRIP